MTEQTRSEFLQAHRADREWRNAQEAYAELMLDLGRRLTHENTTDGGVPDGLPLRRWVVVELMLMLAHNDMSKHILAVGRGDTESPFAAGDDEVLPED